jgi:hypothetical protein
VPRDNPFYGRKGSGGFSVCTPLDGRSAPGKFCAMFSIKEILLLGSDEEKESVRLEDCLRIF